MPFVVLGGGVLALAVALLLVVRRGGDPGPVAPTAPPPPVLPWPTGPAAVSAEVWQEALRRWRGSSDPAEVAAAAKAVQATGQVKPFRKAAGDLLRAGKGPAPLADLVKAVDGSVFRKRPALEKARWKGHPEYRRLEPFAEGTLCFPVQLPSVDAGVRAIRDYDERVRREAAEEELDALRALADPDGKGLALEKKVGKFLWLAPTGIGDPSPDLQVPLWEAAFRFAWSFAAKVPPDQAFADKGLAFVLSPTAKTYDLVGEEGRAYVAAVVLPHGDDVERRVEAAAALAVGAYESAFRLGVNRNRENLRHALGMRWAMAFAMSPGDLTPLAFPVMRDRGIQALRKVLGKSPRVPPWGVVLDAALQEDIRRSGSTRIADLDPLPRAAYVFLAYRMIMRGPGILWDEEQMKALAEERPIPLISTKQGLASIAWTDFVGRMRAAADDPSGLSDFRLGGVGLNALFCEWYVPWVLDGEPSHHPPPDTRGK